MERVDTETKVESGSLLQRSEGKENVNMTTEKTEQTMAERMVDIAKGAGVSVEEQTSFYKLKVGARAIYISKSSKTPRVDLSGFDFEHPGVRSLGRGKAKKLKLGKVQAQLDFSKGEAQALEAFSTAVSLLLHLAQQPTEQQAQLPNKLSASQIPVLTADPEPRRKRGAKRAPAHKPQPQLPASKQL